MGKVLIHYFSGTRNSLLAAEQIGAELRKYDWKLAFHPVEKGFPNNIGSFGLHIFFFPIYATAIPHIMLKYIHGLPVGNNTGAVVISTNGRISTRFRDGYQGWALYQARLALKLKKYHVFLSETLDYPHNVTIAGPPRRKKFNQQIIEQVLAKLPDLAEKIVKGLKFHRSFFWPNILWSLPFGYLFSWFGRHILGKFFTADSRCNNCGVCVKQCPAKTIRFRSGKIKWGWNCEGCLRCINHCPKKAIQLSAIRLIVPLAALFINPMHLIPKTISGWVLQEFGKTGSTIFSILLLTVFYIIFVVIFDEVIYQVSRIPLLKNMVNWGHTKYYGRYSAKNYEIWF